ncbi:HOTHEAD-like isoform X2 [Olea europaea subsp. europaea]|nr:HOTHEAD-like isoform X2 [Olea europaea subsp. europaea]
MHEANSAPEVSYYDYIIVGGGTAGCPLAATLSQNSTVLLLERGGSPYGNPNITNLEAFGEALSDLSPSSPSQRFISEDGVINARARVLGGGSCLNAGFYTRAAPLYVDDAGWDGLLVNESYRWVEKKVAFEPPMRLWQSAVRNGLLEAGVTPYNGFTYDHLIGTKVGGTIFDVEGHRHTAADLLEYANPNGLTVLLHASVHKIMFRINGKEKPTAQGVVFRDASGIKHRSMLGPVGPIISCIDSFLLSRLLCQCITLNNHIFGMLNYRMSKQSGCKAIVLRPPQLATVIRDQYSAILMSNFLNPNLQIGQLSTVPPKERTPDALAKAIDAMQQLEPEAFIGGFILEKIIGPISTGNLLLRSKNPNDNPSVTFNYFKEPQDLQRCIDGFKIIENVVESKSFSEFKYDFLSLPFLLNLTVNAPVNLLPKHANASTSLEQFCKDTVMTIWHYHGGCQVGRVVDPDYKVLGVDALRVIDGSTFNYSPGTNPQATVMMLGRYMGVRILKERLEGQ